MNLKLFKVGLLSIALMFLLLGCSAPRYTPEKYFGRPKKVETIKYSLIPRSDKIIEERPISRSVQMFNRRGRIVGQVNYNHMGEKVLPAWVDTYDKKGHLIELISYENDRSVRSRTLYTYNKRGQLISTKQTGALNYLVTQTYNNENHTAEILGKKSDGTFTERTILKYDSLWRRTELLAFDKNNVQTRRIEFDFDSKGNEVESRWYDSKNQLYEFYKTSFNDYKQKIKTEHFRITKGDTVFAELTLHDYLFDLHKNWVEEKISTNGRVFSLIKRNISY